MNEAMGRIRSLILGTKSEDVDCLRERYGAPPSQYVTLSNGENIHLRDEGDNGAPRLSFSMDTVKICIHGIDS